MAALVVGGWLVYKRAVEPNLPQFSPPESLEAEGPSVGADLMERRVFFEAERLNAVADIAVGDLDDSPGTEIVLSGVHAAAVLDASGEKIAITEYALDPNRSNARFVEVVDVEGDGTCEFLAHGSHLTGGPAVLLDHSGEIIWESSEAPNALTAGDVDGDGELEFAGIRDGIALVETDGTTAWHRELGYHAGMTVGMADVTGDGHPEIIHPHVEIEPEQTVEITGRDAAGEVVYETPRTDETIRGGLFSSFSICPWPAGDGGPHLLASESRRIVLFTLEGKNVLRGEAPGTNGSDLIWGTPFQPRSDQGSFLASIALSNKFEATYLRIHSAEGELLFEQATKLSDDDAIWPGLAAWRPPGEDHEVLLVGGNGKVWKYEMVGGS